MALTNLFLPALAAFAGGAALFSLEAEDPYIQSGGYAPIAAADYPDCGLSVAPDAEGGRILTAWASPDLAGDYRLVVTRRMGGGGFDIVQEGDVDPAWADDGLSEVWVGDNEDFSARLDIWAQSSEPVCSAEL